MIFKGKQQKRKILLGGVVFVVGSAVFWYVILKNSLHFDDLTIRMLKGMYFLGIVTFPYVSLQRYLVEKMKESTTFKQKARFFGILVLAIVLLSFFVFFILSFFKP